MDIEAEVLQAISHPMRADSCFVCGSPLTEKTRTREDVIPKWIQRKYGLEDGLLTLINGTSMPYRQLTVPCCLECNGRHLSRIERRISEAIELGYEGVAKLPEGFLFQWMAKVYLGIVYKELFLVNDRGSPQSGFIRTMDELQNIRILWYWLRQSFTPENAMTAPGSLWVFPCLIPPKDLGEAFDLHDFHAPPTLGIRLGGTAIIADFLDCGILKSSMPDISTDIQRMQLSPEQFIELFVRISYKASTLGMYTSVCAVSSADGKQRLAFVPKSMVPGESLFREWINKEYADFLAARLDLSVDDLLNADGTVRSWIYDSEGNLKQYGY